MLQCTNLIYSKKYKERAFHQCITQAMSHHHWGQTVKIFGIESPTNGRCCEEHTICGAVLREDCVVRFRKVEVIVNEKEESAIAAFWVSDGVDWCCIGFLM